MFIPTCQVRIVKFYVSCVLLLLLLLLLLLFVSVVCRTSTAIVRVQRSVPELNCNVKSSRFRAGPACSVPRRTSTAILKICQEQCQNMSERMSENMSRRMSKDMSKRMSQDMSKNNVKKYVGKNVKQNVKRYARKNVTRYEVK